MQGSIIFDRANLPLPVRTASCTILANYAKTHHQWVTSGYKSGDILFMHRGKDFSLMEHMGIINEVADKYIVTYEGNTFLASQANGGSVMECNRAFANTSGAYRPWYNL